MNVINHKPALLVVASTFPRWEGDREPPFVFELCRRLVDAWDVHVLAPLAAGARREENMEGITVTRFPYFLKPWQRLAYDGGILPNLKRRPWLAGTVPFFLAGELAAILGKLQSRRFAVVHAHWLIPQGLMTALALLLTGDRIPFLSTTHGGDMYGLQGWLFDALRRFVLHRSAGITAVSRAMGASAVALGARPEALKIIPMGVDLQSVFIPPAVPRGGNRLLFVGRLVEKKGLSYLIKAMHRIVQRHPDVQLTVVGSGPEENRLKHEAATLGLSGRIVFSGSVTNAELPPFYQEADICVFPSGDREGFGLVLVEALGCSCPVVATDLPAVRDVVIPGRTGLLVPEKSPESLAECISGLLENPERRESLGREGRQFVLVRYDWAIIAAAYSRFLEELMCRGTDGCNS